MTSFWQMGNPFDTDVINYDVIRAGKEFNNNNNNNNKTRRTFTETVSSIDHD